MAGQSAGRAALPLLVNIWHDADKYREAVQGPLNEDNHVAVMQGTVAMRPNSYGSWSAKPAGVSGGGPPMLQAVAQQLGLATGTSISMHDRFGVVAMSPVVLAARDFAAGEADSSLLEQHCAQPVAVGGARRLLLLAQTHEPPALPPHLAPATFATPAVAVLLPAPGLGSGGSASHRPGAPLLAALPTGAPAIIPSSGSGGGSATHLPAPQMQLGGDWGGAGSGGGRTAGGSSEGEGQERAKRRKASWFPHEALPEMAHLLLKVLPREEQPPYLPIRAGTLVKGTPQDRQRIHAIAMLQHWAVAVRNDQQQKAAQRGEAAGASDPPTIPLRGINFPEKLSKWVMHDSCPLLAFPSPLTAALPTTAAHCWRSPPCSLQPCPPQLLTAGVPLPAHCSPAHHSCSLLAFPSLLTAVPCSWVRSLRHRYQQALP
jgi:hypothetical protein